MAFVPSGGGLDFAGSSAATAGAGPISFGGLGRRSISVRLGGPSMLDLALIAGATVLAFVIVRRLVK